MARHCRLEPVQEARQRTVNGFIRELPACAYCEKVNTGLAIGETRKIID
jgi:hypothetical protein